MGFTGSKTTGMCFLWLSFTVCAPASCLCHGYSLCVCVLSPKLKFSILFSWFNVKGIHDFTAIHILVYYSDCQEHCPETNNSWGNICLKAVDDIHGVDYGSLTGISPTLYEAYGGFWSRVIRSGSVHGPEEELRVLGWPAALSCDRLEREVLAGGGNPSGMWGEHR